MSEKLPVDSNRQYLKYTRCPHIVLCCGMEVSKITKNMEGCMVCRDALFFCSSSPSMPKPSNVENELQSIQSQCSVSIENECPYGDYQCLMPSCGFIGCNYKMHYMKHASSLSHPIGMNLKNGKIFCNKCNIEFDSKWNCPQLSVQLDILCVYTDQSSLPLLTNHELLWPDLVYVRAHDDCSMVPGLVGLINSDNSCFANAVVQCLSNCAPMTINILSDFVDTNTPLLKSYKRILRRLWIDYKGCLPASIRDICAHIHIKTQTFQLNVQHDAQEFLRCLLDQLHDEMNQETKQIGKTLIQSLFGGRMSSSVRCLKCNNVSSVIENFQDISIPVLSNNEKNHIINNNNQHHRRSQTNINNRQTVSTATVNIQNDELQEDKKTFIIIDWLMLIFSFFRPIWDLFIQYDYFSNDAVTLDDLFEAYMTPEILEGDNQYRCDFCESFTNGLREFNLVELPEILSIHLKRFRQDASGFTRKLQQYVSFPAILNLSKFVYSAHCEDVICNFELFGIICHEGNSTGGHYVAYSRNFFDGNWYEFNDTSVFIVTERLVLSKQAYLLFYHKVPEIPSRSKFELVERVFKSYYEKKLAVDIQSSSASSPSSCLLAKSHVNNYFLTSEEYMSKQRNDHLFCEKHGFVRPERWKDLPKLVHRIPAQVYEDIFIHGPNASESNNHTPPSRRRHHHHDLSICADSGPCVECLRNSQHIMHN